MQHLVDQIQGIKFQEIGKHFPELQFYWPHYLKLVCQLSCFYNSNWIAYRPHNLEGLYITKR